MGRQAAKTLTIMQEQEARFGRFCSVVEPLGKRCLLDLISRRFRSGNERVGSMRQVRRIAAYSASGEIQILPEVLGLISTS